MSEFRCDVVRVEILPHPNADQLELAKVGDYMAVVRKGQFVTGNLAVYIPEQAVIPEWLLKEMGMWDEAKQKGGLAGSLGNRVKAIKLRGVLSQGLVLALVKDETRDGVVTYGAYRWSPGIQTEIEELYHADGGRQAPVDAWKTEGIPSGRNFDIFVEGDDVAEFLGIVKYEPALPSHMRGKIVGIDYGATAKYDFDNLKKTPTLFDDGEEVVITEKVHGTLIQVGVVPTDMANEKYFCQRVVISSKGMGAKGFVLDHADETNLYAQAAKKHGLLEAMLEVFGEAADRQGAPIFIFGEVFGKTGSGAGVQDLTYTDEVLDFRAFDICLGNRSQERYFAWDHFELACHKLNVKTVPVLYRGPYSKSVVLEHTDGNTTLSDKKQIREGVVVKSAVEARNQHYGRKIAKSISEAYLLRKGNTSEFQ